MNLAWNELSSCVPHIFPDSHPHEKNKCCFKVLRIPVDFPPPLSSPDMASGFGITQNLSPDSPLFRNKLVQLWNNLRDWQGTFLTETKLEDSHSKTLPAALHQSKTAQGEYEIAPAKHKGIAWHQIFCVTCVLQVYCRIYPGSRCLWLVEWYQNQD